MQIFAKCTQIWDILRTTHLQEPYVSLVAAQLHFAQHSCCDATCARVSNNLDLICRRDFAQTENLVTRQPLILFVLADYECNQLSFIDILDLASTIGVVAMIPSKHPKVVCDHFFKHWITPFGVPRSLIFDQGEEFEREFGQELEDLGCEPMPTAAITPQQNAVCERHAGIWKTQRDDCLTSSASSLCLNSCTV